MSGAGLFVTGTGTGAGKTTIGCQLTRRLRDAGRDVVALKPIETGVDPSLGPADAIALAEACGRPELARDPRWYRARLPLSPYAAHLEGEPEPDLAALAAAVRDVAGTSFALVEGAGGLLVPLTREATIADLAAALGLPLLIVAPDRLGVLSDVLAAVGAARERGLRLAAVHLNRFGAPDPSVRTNLAILRERLAPLPVEADTATLVPLFYM